MLKAHHSHTTCDVNYIVILLYVEQVLQLSGSTARSFRIFAIENLASFGMDVDRWPMAWMNSIQRKMGFVWNYRQDRSFFLRLLLLPACMHVYHERIFFITYSSCSCRNAYRKAHVTPAPRQYVMYSTGLGEEKDSYALVHAAMIQAPGVKKRQGATEDDHIHIHFSQVGNNVRNWLYLAESKRESNLLSCFFSQKNTYKVL